VSATMQVTSGTRNQLCIRTTVDEQERDVAVFVDEPAGVDAEGNPRPAKVDVEHAVWLGDRVCPDDAAVKNDMGLDRDVEMPVEDEVGDLESGSVADRLSQFERGAYLATLPGNTPGTSYQTGIDRYEKCLPIVNTVQNQGTCGSCYVFAGTGVAAINKCAYYNRMNPNFKGRLAASQFVSSKQELLDCSNSDGSSDEVNPPGYCLGGGISAAGAGCEGGHGILVLDFLVNNLPSTAEEYPYSGENQGNPADHFDAKHPPPRTCLRKPPPAEDSKEFVSRKSLGVFDVMQVEGEEPMMAAIMQFGSVGVSFDTYSDIFDFVGDPDNEVIYKGATTRHDDADKLSKSALDACKATCQSRDASGNCACAYNKGGHTVVAVGWGVTPMGTKYWILRNSWGADVHAGGFLHWQRGINLFGIETRAYTASGVNQGGYQASSNDGAGNLPAASECIEVANVPASKGGSLEEIQLHETYKVTEGSKTFMQKDAAESPLPDRCFVRNTCDTWKEIVIDAGSVGFKDEDDRTKGCSSRYNANIRTYLVPPQQMDGKPKVALIERWAAPGNVPFLLLEPKYAAVTYRNCYLASEKDADLSEWTKEAGKRDYQFVGIRYGTGENNQKWLTDPEFCPSCEGSF